MDFPREGDATLASPERDHDADRLDESRTQDHGKGLVRRQGKDVLQRVTAGHPPNAGEPTREAVLPVFHVGDYVPAVPPCNITEPAANWTGRWCRFSERSP